MTHMAQKYEKKKIMKTPTPVKSPERKSKERDEKSNESATPKRLPSPGKSETLTP